MESINERIQLIINEYYKKNVSAFSEDCGISQKTINDIVGKKKNEPSYGTISKILTAKAVKINPVWLQLGEEPKIRHELAIPIIPEKSEEIRKGKIKKMASYEKPQEPAVLKEGTNCEKLTSKIECLQEILSIKDGEIARLNQEIGRLQQQLDGKKGEANCGQSIGGDGKINEYIEDTNMVFRRGG